MRLGEYEQFSFKGANGDTVYGYVMKPWNYEPGKKYPVAFLVHGGPQGSFGNHWHYRWNPQVYAGAGYAAVIIDFHGSTGYGQAFTDAISGDWGGKPLEDLKKGLAAALAKYTWLDGAHACALGASYGGYMMNWIEGNWSDRFKCIVGHDGVFDTRGMAYSTEELWFPEWENGGGPTSRCRTSTSNSTRSTTSTSGRRRCWWSTAAWTSASRHAGPVDVHRAAAPRHRSELLLFPDENHWVLKPANSVLWHHTVLAGWIAICSRTDRTARLRNNLPSTSAAS